MMNLRISSKLSATEHGFRSSPVFAEPTESVLKVLRYNRNKLVSP